MDQTRRKSAAALLSVVSNTTLVLGKLVAGLMMGSIAVLSEAIHSAVDLVAALIAWFAVRQAGRPADREHPWGHGKIENVSGAVEALLIVGAAIVIIVQAVGKLAAREEPELAGLGVLVMAVSALVNWLVSRHLFAVGRATESIALQADAWHLRTDVWTSLGVMAALALVGAGQRLAPDLPVWWLDPVAAIAVALLIFKAGWDLTRRAVGDMLDVSLPPDEVEWLRATIAAAGGVRGVHGLRTRRAGAQRFIEFHMLVDPQTSTAAAHHLAEELTATIRRRFEGASVTPHVEPCDGGCDPRCVAGCLLPEAERERRGQAGRAGGAA